MLCQDVIFLIGSIFVRVVVLLGGLLEHEPLHHADFLLQLALLLCHEIFDELEDLLVALGKLENVLDVELIDDSATLFLLLLVALRVLFLI